MGATYQKMEELKRKKKNVLEAYRSYLNFWIGCSFSFSRFVDKNSNLVRRSSRQHAKSNAIIFINIYMYGYYYCYLFAS